MPSRPKLQWDADGRAAQREMVALQKEIIKIREENQKLRKVSRDAARDAKKDLREQREAADRAADAYKAVAAGIATVGAAALKAGIDVATFKAELGDKEVSADRSVRQLAKQAKSSVSDARQLLASSIRVGDRSAVPAATSETAIRELISQGATNPELSLRFLLPALQAANAADEDPTQAVRAITGFIAGAGEEKTPGNIRKVARTAALAFADKPLQFADLSSLAKNASKATAAGVSLEEQIAAFVTLQEKGQPVDLAGSGVGRVALELATAGSQKTRVAALEKAGLTPQDISPLTDGQGLRGSLSVLQQGLGNVPENERAALLTQIVGKESFASAQLLLSNQQLLQKNLQLGNNAGLFEQQVALGSRGASAAGVRLENLDRLRAVEGSGREAIQNLVIQEQIRQLENGGFIDQSIAARAKANPEFARLLNESLPAGPGLESAAEKVQTLSGNDPEVIKLLEEISGKLDRRERAESIRGVSDEVGPVGVNQVVGPRL